MDEKKEINIEIDSEGTFFPTGNKKIIINDNEEEKSFIFTNNFPDKHVIIKKYHRCNKHEGKPGIKQIILTKIINGDNTKKMLIVLPGIDKQNLEIKAKRRAILIEATYLPEFHDLFGEKITKKIRLPFEINPDKIDASYKTGVIKLEFLDINDPTVTIPVDTEED